MPVMAKPPSEDAVSLEAPLITETPSSPRLSPPASLQTVDSESFAGLSLPPLASALDTAWETAAPSDLCRGLLFAHSAMARKPQMSSPAQIEPVALSLIHVASVLHLAAQ
eukprot:CAMPEP_0169423616 /NCGR_PEP_ID=MMETSP1017-20121227/67593_1 /TAXON_ID=342587 /ORGANISM="Karlodinium micrum, Strain CCMP2283" /LENGTH=109 /DNA_ID=CAMNT_0009533327 /DNA_START=342 /DNA_END=672 /DNA_ORIENTATION=-